MTSVKPFALNFFNRLENMTTVLLLNLMTTPAGDSVPFALDLIRNVTASLVQSMRVQTGKIRGLSRVQHNKDMNIIFLFL